MAVPRGVLGYLFVLSDCLVDVPYEGQGADHDQVQYCGDKDGFIAIDLALAIVAGSVCI